MTDPSSVDAEHEALGQVIRILEPLDAKARERVVGYLVHRYAAVSVGRAPAREPPLSAPEPQAGHAGWNVALTRFADRHGIPVGRIGEIVDIDSRDVHNLSAWKGVVEQNCRLAAMLSLCQVAVDGTFQVSQKDLARSAKLHAIYDPDSQATYLRRLRFEGSIVFTRENRGEPWRLTPTAGQKYVAESVKIALDIAPATGEEGASK
jgi:hypothetical protein